MNSVPTIGELTFVSFRANVMSVGILKCKKIATSTARNDTEEKIATSTARNDDVRLIITNCELRINQHPDKLKIINNSKNNTTPERNIFLSGVDFFVQSILIFPKYAKSIKKT